MPSLQAASSMTYSVRLFTSTDGRVHIVGNKEVRALLSACGFAERTNLLIRATPDGRITLSTSVERLYGESAEITSEICDCRDCCGVFKKKEESK